LDISLVFTAVCTHATQNFCAFINKWTNRAAGIAIPLFFCPLGRRRSRIPAAEEWSVADSFLYKQKKQRGLV
jgi:hypothetical protein